MYLIQTVQTSWRPQLPLPKEPQLTDERHSAEDDNNTKANNNSNNNNNKNTGSTTTSTNNNHSEQDMERLRMNGSAQQLSNKQKWSFGRLFRNKKKDAEECSASSSEEDRKAGFVPAQRQSSTKPKAKAQHNSKSKSQGFDHIVGQAASPPPPHPPQPAPQHIDNEFFLPVEMVGPAEPYYQNQPAYYTRSSNSLDRRLYLTQPSGQGVYATHAAQPAQVKSRSAQRLKPQQLAPKGHSSEEELISLNSSTFSKYRSDDSIHRGGQQLLGAAGAGDAMPGQSRRSRAARNERYYKRLSRDGEVSHGGVPAQIQQQQQQQQQRYKTQPLPLSIYQVAPAAAGNSYVQWQPQPQPQPQPQRSLQNSMQSDGKRSISYDSQIHLQNVSGRMQSKPLPPPPPPRDPLRRVCHMGSSSSDLRPVSYAFDQSGRCVSDDRIWQPPHYQSVHSLNSQPGSSIVSAPTSQQLHSRRFITRSERNAQPGKKSLPNGIDFHYVADATPRSRRPIHMLEATQTAAQQANAPVSSGILRTSRSGLANDSWPTAQRAQQLLNNKPRSISSSRLCELRSYPVPMYSEVQKPKRAPAPAAAPLETDNIICGSLCINPVQNQVEIRHRDMHMPHYQQQQQQQQRRSGEDLSNKYDEYVAEKREQHQQAPAPIYTERKASLPAAPVAPIYFPRKKPANLEEAINELEAIYKSLGLTEPQESKPQELKAEPKPRMPTPSDFEKFALAHADDYDDEDSPAGEPDPVRDDVAYRNLQLANLQHRVASEKQPPFGIPVGPIVPAPQSDYLHVEPVCVPKKKKSGSPDIVKDDLAVRALRKDPPGPKSHYPAMYPMQKKQRATRTQSANIYNLIQRDAAKPSGGDMHSYMELTRSIERAGSMSNLAAGDASDVPATFDLLRKLKAQDAQEELQQKKPQAHIPFRHPSQGGAIAQLPERLGHEETTSKLVPPVPAPRKSLTPEPLLEDALNKLAQDAQASSIKLSQELQELRKEALITAARPKLSAEQQKLEEELQQIEAVSEAAKRCGQMLLDTLPDNDELDTSEQGQHERQQQQQANPRKLQKEVKLIKAIDEVSEAANAVCEKILKDIVTTEPPVVVHEALQVRQAVPHAGGEAQLVMPHLIKKLDPIQSDKIEAIAKRCMRQLSELANESAPDYDNLPAACNMSTAGTGHGVQADATLICPIAELKLAKNKSKTRAQAKSEALEDIDRIMQECERQARQGGTATGCSNVITLTTSNSIDEQRTTAPSMSSGSVSGGSNQATTASSFSSSSDCLAKSSSPSTASRPMSSSITSFNPYSSSDYIKSQSSDYHAPSTDPIKTFSTTSYDVQSTPNNTTISTTSTTSCSSTTNNNNNSNSNSNNNIQSISSEQLTTSVTSDSGSPPLQLTPVGERRERSARSSSSPSQYNSSEELAAIFGIEEKPKQRKQLSNATGKGVAQIAQAAVTATNTSCDPAANKSCDPATLATNPVLNAPLEFEPQFDVTTTTTTTTSSNSCTTNTTNTSTSASTLPTYDCASSASNSSSHSYKLATIPELDAEAEADHAQTQLESSLKLSPNFNRIYASKIDIVVDTTAVVAANTLTQFDSLSSLEETSSNPDSGNASLADYPLAGHANASLELQTTYNSRFEVREHYISEVSLSATASSEEDTVSECRKFDQQPLSATKEEDFPRLPTEEELLDSLREEVELNETLGIVQVEQQTAKVDKQSDVQPNESLQLDETIKLSEAVYDVTSELLLKEAQTQLELNEKELDESELEEWRLIELALEEALLEEIELDNSEPAKQLDEELSTKTIYNESELNKLNEIDAARRTSIIYETPQINLSISELKLNYETKVEQETQCKALDEAKLPRQLKNESSDKAHRGEAEAEAEEEEQLDDSIDGPINDTLARNERSQNRTEANESATTRQRGQGRLPAQSDADSDADELPTTSSKALSVFGEVRTVRTTTPSSGVAATATGLTRGGLTTLEHVLVACTVGLITPNDLLTLCLIIIGVIIIVAIALA